MDRASDRLAIALIAGLLGLGLVNTVHAASPCDLNNDALTNVSDVQFCANQAVGFAPCSNGDIDLNGTCSVIDVQRVVNAALGGQCVSPSTTTARGPQASITCPAGAVVIAAGSTTSSRQALINGNAEGTTFCLKAGVHTANGSNTPRSRMTFVGEYGAIIDGTGWISSDATQAVFKAHNQDINNVTIKNLVFRYMPQYAIRAQAPFARDAQGHILFGLTSGADGWVIENNEIGPGLYGIDPGNNSAVRNNTIHHNIGPSQAQGHEYEWGGGICGNTMENMVVENNEFAYNGSNNRVFYTRGAIYRNNFIHHGAWDGLWFDGENTNVTIANNIIEDNPASCIVYEISGSANIYGNTLRRCGESGIYVSISHGVNIYNNTIETSASGINLAVVVSRLSEPDNGEPASFQNISVHDNIVRVRNASGSVAVYFTPSGTATEVAPYLNGSKNITFARNTYYAPTLTGSYWTWGQGAFKTWSQWQAIPQDATSTLAVYP